MSDKRWKDLFLSLSSALTGFSEVDLQGTGMVETYFRVTVDKAREQLHAMLLTWRELEQLPVAERDSELRLRLFADEGLGPVTQQLIKMWYLGQWEAGFPPDVISPQAYKQGLVWVAMNAHTQGAKQEGFGSWALPPRGAVDQCEEEESS